MTAGGRKGERRERTLKQGTKRDAWDLLERPAAWLWKRQEARGRPGGSAAGRKRMEALSALYGQAGAREEYRRFQIGRYERLLALLLAGTGLTAALLAASWLGEREAVDKLKRPVAGEGGRSVSLDVQIGEEAPEQVSLNVPERAFSPEEEDWLLEEASSRLSSQMEGEGWDPDAVRSDLELPRELCGGLVEVTWQSSDYDLMDGSGKIREQLLPEEGEAVTLTAVLSCGEDSRTLTFPLRLVPEETGASARLLREVGRRMEEDSGEEEVPLPAEFEGQKVSWYEPASAPFAWSALLTAAGCLALYAAWDRDLLEEGKRRREELALAYPSFLAKTALFAGTGMPLRTIFFRMAKDGQKRGAGPVEEELLRACREMESGVTQLQAIESFGRRCGLPQYKKYASLLSQNLQRGTGGLLEALNREAEDAFEERKRYAKRRGDEAQTRLLAPMLMMLAVIMMLILVPACFSFGGI
ncbi:MAG TPA: type II secretion system F family protein [Candidatus Eisenbergiella merdigallinarum]|uniref:Type II secretion system F family protein n=1 Tax=Candidatus Eisenbergiella merdigallinarum TaxID=2838552 RepID=A0A9D2MT27_9FIRM|nr:type II secretion system F family protein [Candidatus Eisenbergiella merdigallinarum]